MLISRFRKCSAIVKLTLFKSFCMSVYDVALWKYYSVTVFRLDALALSVIATATWLAGWLSHSGIVSKPLNLSENFFHRLKAPSL